MEDCTIIRPGDSYSGRQGLDYAAGVSAESAGSHGLCMHRLTLQPGQRARAHLPANLTDQPAEAVIARTDPNEQESVVLLPELDALPHLP